MCLFENGLFSWNWKHFAESIKKKSWIVQWDLWIVLKSAIWPINNSKNKLKLQINRKFQSIPKKQIKGKFWLLWSSGISLSRSLRPLLLQYKHTDKQTKTKKQKTMVLFGKGFLVVLFKFCENTRGWKSVEMCIMVFKHSYRTGPILFIFLIIATSFYLNMFKLVRWYSLYINLNFFITYIF